MADDENDWSEMSIPGGDFCRMNVQVEVIIVIVWPDESIMGCVFDISFGSYLTVASLVNY